MDAPEVRVLIADDQKIVRDGLSMIMGLLEGITVIGTAVDGADAVRQARALQPDVIVMDLNMPVMNGAEATEVLSREMPAVKVLVLTTYADDQWVFAALRAGARGFLTKDAGAEEIRHALLSVAAGEAQLDPTVQRRLLEALRRGDHTALAPEPADVRSDGGNALTARETEVLVLIAEGLSNKEIADRLFVSDSTIKTHINHLLAKTGMRDRAQLVAYAYRHRLVTG
ncbi:DNA-binding NarL/FixJ family response regulator [Pseudarthrobacter defluvii]|uniref:response regulator n=1 Tax=Pseudarthrobacter defluvii TaxID=410837 RepID=UPI00278479FF|nr:response regulator transcription factor [Pseudarthrobacter defluvii]MDQ0769411.1 DNA-binding NarL/FixJ family response regulator [Pseudarthrobacter defluvii]